MQFTSCFFNNQLININLKKLINIEYVIISILYFDQFYNFLLGSIYAREYRNIHYE
jgi:hypothetical protein